MFFVVFWLDDHIFDVDFNYLVVELMEYTIHGFFIYIASVFLIVYEADDFVSCSNIYQSIGY
jgi:hypothetical protein